MVVLRPIALDGSGSNYGGFGRQKRGGAPRRERDESIIEERIQRERPCRTLFIRNIKASLDLKPTERLSHLHPPMTAFSSCVMSRKLIFTVYSSMKQTVTMYVVCSKSMERLRPFSI